MKKILSYLIVGCFLAIGIGCSIEEAKQPEEYETEEGQDIDVDTTEEQEQETVKPAIVDQLKEKALIGEHLEEVQRLLGEPTVEDKNTVLHAWRYDFPLGDYTFDNHLNAVDVEGIYNGDMEAQLMVFFEKEVVSSYSIYYIKADDIMQYWVTINGAEEFVASAD